MGTFQIDGSSLKKFLENVSAEEAAEIKRIKENFENRNLIPNLPRDIGVDYGDKKIREVIQKEAKKIRNRSGKRIIKDDDIRCRYGSERVSHKGDRHNSDLRYRIYNDKHTGQDYRINEAVGRYRWLHYWFGDVPGWVEDKRSNTQPSGEFPLYGTSKNEMYFKSLFPGENAPGSYVYKPYIINNQPSANDYVYWTDYNRPCGSYLRNVYDKGGKLVHRVGDAKYTRMRSAGDRVGGKIDRTWYNKSDKGFIRKIVKRINKLPVEVKNTKLTLVSAKTDPDRVVLGTRVNVNVKYKISTSAKLGDKFK